MSWSIATVTMLVATIPELIACIISIKGYISKKYPHFLYMFITWFFLWFGNLLLGIAYLLLDPTIYRIGIIISAPLAFSIMALVDMLSREHIHLPKLFIITIISTSLIIFAGESDSVSLNTSYLGEQTLSLTGGFMVAGALTFLFSGILWLYYMLKIHLNVPESIRKYSKINLIGAVLAGPGSIVMFSSGMVWIIPGIDYVFIGSGALLCSYAFQKQPKLGYILPFKVFRILCINSVSGVPIFSYDWDDQDVIDSSLLGGTIQGVSAILNEAIKRGVVNEVQFDMGTMILHHHEETSIIFVLISSKSSPILEHALRLFGHNFNQKFQKELKSEIMNIDEFASAEQIVNRTFPFIPT
ncbi:MAG: hypothetical protein ACTSR3_15080 [Candidatus Helarchaeota archaeon]